MKITELARVVSSALLLSLAPLCATAQMSLALDRFSMSVGAFNATPQFGATVSNSQGSVSTIGIETKRKTMARATGEILLGDHHGISFDAFRYSQDYSKINQGGYSSGPVGLGATTTVKLGFDLTVARIGYRYWLGSNNTVFGIGAGLGYYHATLHTQTSIALLRTIPSLGLVSSNSVYYRHDSEEAVAPMLELGVRHSLSSELRLFADASGIHKGGNGVRGSIYNTVLGVEWFPLKNLGLSAAYVIADVDLKREGDGVQGLRVKFHGPVVALKARF